MLNMIITSYQQISVTDFYRNSYQALKLETANLLYFSAYIIRLIYKVADFVV